MANEKYDAKNPGVAVHTWLRLSSKIKLIDYANEDNKSLSKFTEEILEQWLKSKESESSDECGESLTKSMAE